LCGFRTGSPVIPRANEKALHFSEAFSFHIQNLCTTQPPSQNTLPGGNTGLRLPAPGRRIHHVNMLERMVSAQILQ
ncbi:hypothetical protein, partial [Planktomarina temperata]|uniref:hypothetical protein n=1 Tax=Planktomarina temperata TaxID=1284658 RepID=UPI0035C82C69